MPKAPSVKQEAQSSDPYKTPPPGRQSSSSSSPVKNESPTKKESPSKKGGPAGQVPVDEMAAKKLKIMTMIFHYAKGLKAEDIAAEVGMTTLQVKNLLQIGRPGNLRFKVLDRVARGEY